jgi:hypothetical protein
MSAKVRQGVAIYEVVIGLIAFVAATAYWGEISRFQIVLGIISGAVSLAAGVLLWRGASIGRRLSLIVQAIQVPQISIAGIVEYGIGLGAAVRPHIGLIPEPFQASIHSLLRFGSGVSGFYVGINVLALVALVLVASRNRESSPNSNHIVAPAQ